MREVEERRDILDMSQSVLWSLHYKQLCFHQASKLGYVVETTSSSCGNPVWEDDNRLTIPCGLLALTLFTDTYAYVTQ